MTDTDNVFASQYLGQVRATREKQSKASELLCDYCFVATVLIKFYNFILAFKPFQWTLVLFSKGKVATKKASS